MIAAGKGKVAAATSQSAVPPWSSAEMNSARARCQKEIKASTDCMAKQHVKKDPDSFRSCVPQISVAVSCLFRYLPHISEAEKTM